MEKKKHSNTYKQAIVFDLFVFVRLYFEFQKLHNKM